MVYPFFIYSVFFVVLLRLPQNFFFGLPPAFTSQPNMKMQGLYVRSERDAKEEDEEEPGERHRREVSSALDSGEDISFGVL
jgi:hypothetical protein